jgi:hypothetical protein
MLIYVAFDIENNSKLPGDKYHMWCKCFLIIYNNNNVKERL